VGYLDVLPYDSVFILVGILSLLPLGLIILINPDRINKLKMDGEEI
jgi:hypothetical protein